MSSNEWEQARAYVERLRQKGCTDEQIRQIMLRGGWTEEQAEKLFARELPRARPPAPRPPPPPPGPSTAPPQRPVGASRPRPRPSARAASVRADASTSTRRTGRVQVRETLSRSWQAFLSNLWLFVLRGDLFWFWGVGALGGLIALGDNNWPLLGGALGLIYLVIGSLLIVGLCIMCLEALRGRRARIPDWHEWWSRVVRASTAGIPFALANAVVAVVVVGAGILVGLAVVAIAALLNVLVFIPLLGMAFPAAADGMGAKEALALSVRQGLSNWRALVVLSLIIVAVSSILVGLTFSLAAVVTVPWAAAVMSAAYLQVIGEAREGES